MHATFMDRIPKGCDEFSRVSLNEALCMKLGVASMF